MTAQVEGLYLVRYFYPPDERSDTQVQMDLLRGEQCIQKLVHIPLQPHQYVALVCLVADVKAGLVSALDSTLEASFLITALQRGMLQIAAAEFYSFCYRDGKVNSRAWQKRRVEHQLFVSGHMLFE